MAQQRRRPNTMVYGNLAYDLDTLASQRQLEEAARPERKSQPQQAPRHRTAARPRQRVSPLALCAVGALAAMSVVLVMGYIQLTAVTGSISDLQEHYCLIIFFPGRMLPPPETNLLTPTHP